jgi:hypothetical protein
MKNLIDVPMFIWLFLKPCNSSACIRIFEDQTIEEPKSQSFDGISQKSKSLHNRSSVGLFWNKLHLFIAWRAAIVNILSGWRRTIQDILVKWPKSNETGTDLKSRWLWTSTTEAKIPSFGTLWRSQKRPRWSANQTSERTTPAGMAENSVEMHLERD